MDRIKINLNASEWQELTSILQSTTLEKGSRIKYMEAIFYPLLKQVFIKLHNKLHSLKERKNTLSLTLPEASVLGMSLLERNDNSYLIVQITSEIDQKLT